MFWRRVKIFLAIVLSLAAWEIPAGHDPEAVRDSLIQGVFLAVSGIVAVLFQLVTSFVYDVLTFRRGMWRIPSLADSPWGSGCPLSTSFFALLALALGLMLLVAAPFQGWPKAILGASCLLASAILHWGQKFVCKVYAARFR